MSYGMADVPIQQGYTTRDGVEYGYYRWGDEGKMYLYTPGNEAERKRAKRKAEEQRQAAYAGGYEG